MGLALCLAEAFNIGLGTVAGQGAASIGDKLLEVGFRRGLVKTLAKSDVDLDSRLARRVFQSNEFLSWLSDGGNDPIERHLTDDQLAAFGVEDETAAFEIGEAIGEAFGEAAFRLADPVQKEILRRFGGLKQDVLGAYRYAKDTHEDTQEIRELLAGGLIQDADVFPIRWQEKSVSAFFTGVDRQLG